VSADEGHHAGSYRYIAVSSLSLADQLPAASRQLRQYCSFAAVGEPIHPTRDAIMARVLILNDGWFQSSLPRLPQCHDLPRKGIP
jgi:hypothetical protein